MRQGQPKGAGANLAWPALLRKLQRVNTGLIIKSDFSTKGYLAAGDQASAVLFVFKVCADSFLGPCRSVPARRAATTSLSADELGGIVVVANPRSNSLKFGRIRVIRSLIT